MTTQRLPARICGVRVRALARACLNTDTSSHTATPFSAHIARPRHFSDMRPQAHVLLDMHACIRLYVGQRNNRTRAALSDKCRSTCGSGYGSELTRRGGGDHGQRQKRVWGAKALTKQQSPPSCTSGSTAAAPYEVSTTYIKGNTRSPPSQLVCVCRLLVVGRGLGLSLSL